MLFVWENHDRQTDRQSRVMSFSFDAKNYIFDYKHRETIFVLV